MAAVLNICELATGNDPANYRCLPIIIRANQCSGPIVQFQCRISQRVGDPMLRELGANCTNDDSFCPRPLNNKTTNHHVVARLNKAAGADVTQADLHQVVTDNVESDCFWRCGRQVGKLSPASERILDIRMCLWAALAQPITEIGV